MKDKYIAYCIINCLLIFYCITISFSYSTNINVNITDQSGNPRGDTRYDQANSTSNYASETSAAVGVDNSGNATSVVLPTLLYL